MNTLHLIRKTFQDWQKKDNQNSKFCDSTKESNNTSHGDENKPVILKWVCKVHTPIMILLSVTSFTGSVSYRFYNQPKLAVGTISPTKIVAPRDADFVDSHTTEELRKKTRSGLLPMLKQDVSLTLKIQTRIDNKLEQIDNLRNLNKKLLLLIVIFYLPLTKNIFILYHHLNGKKFLSKLRHHHFFLLMNLYH